MKHALIITTIGGFLPQFEMNDVEILQENGYTVHYASDFENPVYNINQTELKNMGLRLHHIDIRKSPFQLKNNIKAFMQLKKIIRQEQIQLIHCHNPMGGVVGRLAAAFCGRKVYVIYTAHGFHFYKGAPKKNWLLFYTAEKFLAHYTNRLITINHEDYERANKFRLRDKGKAERIPGVGVNTIKFQKKEELCIPKREELNIPKDVFHIVSVGEINDNKNHEIMIRAMAMLGEKDIYYSICGKGSKEEYLSKMIRDLGLTRRVRLLGYRTDISEVLQSADCFAFPSRREGLGIAAIEAMACGVPLIAADSRGTREYLRDGVNGFVCKADCADDFVRAVQRLKASPELCRSMSENCREMAKHFSIEATDKIMRHIYCEADGEWEREEGYGNWI